MTEELIRRAAGLLAWMSEPEAADHLKEEGIAPDLAFLAVRAAGCLVGL